MMDGHLGNLMLSMQEKPAQLDYYWDEMPYDPSSSSA
jgi:hypothetical protein